MSLENMTLEEVFVRGCYYHANNNPIWYIYRANLARTAEDIKREASDRELRNSLAFGFLGAPVKAVA